MKKLISKSSPIFDQSIDRHRTISPDLVDAVSVRFIVMVTNRERGGRNLAWGKAIV
jgi:hypothetical protein